MNGINNDINSIRPRTYLNFADIYFLNTFVNIKIMNIMIEIIILQIKKFIENIITVFLSVKRRVVFLIQIILCLRSVYYAYSYS